MEVSSWKKLLKHSVEQADILNAIERHQKKLDALSDYEGRLYIDGESYNTDTLKLLYLEALDNVCSNTVLDLLSSIDSNEVRDGLINDVFLDIAIDQHKKTRFFAQLGKAGKKDSQSISQVPKPDHLCRYTVEDALSSLGIEVRLNLVTKRMEVAGFGSEALYELYSESNILSILPLIVRDKLKSEGVTGLGQGNKMIEEYLFSIADQNRYNPIHEMLEKSENEDAGSFDML